MLDQVQCPNHIPAKPRDIYHDLEHLSATHMQLFTPFQLFGAYADNDCEQCKDCCKGTSCTIDIGPQMFQGHLSEDINHMPKQ